MSSSTVETLIANLQDPTHCYICEANLQDPNNSAHHYASMRHQDNVKSYRKAVLEKLQQNKSTKVVNKIQTSAKANVPPQETIYCQICNVDFDRNSSNQHYQESEHKKKEEAYCKVCNILTMSKEQLWQHMHGSKHKSKLQETGLPAIDVQYGPFDLTLPMNLKKIMQPDLCQICHAKFPTLKHALDHYKSQKHKSAIQHWFKEKKKNEKVGSSNNGNVSEGNNSVIQTSKSLLKLVDYNCFVCKVNVHAESEVDNHRTSFPHTALAKLKSDTVSKGIIEEYWVRQGSSILCTLCGVRICTMLDADEHFINASHSLKFRDWCKRLDPTKVPSESDIKWYYCKICDRALDCTSESVRHYQSIPHQKKSELYCELCEVRNPTQELLEIHYTTTLHIENKRKSEGDIREGVKRGIKNIPRLWQRHLERKLENNDTLEAGKSEKYLQNNIEEKNYEQDSSCLLNGSEVNTSETNKTLKEQVFQEIQKLIETLYLSEKVPYDVALKYIKKVNQEIADLKKKYEKKESQDVEAKSSCSGSQEDMKPNFDEKKIPEISNKGGSSYIQDLSIEDDYHSFTSDTVLPKEIMTVFDLIDLSNELHAAKAEVVENIPEKIQSAVNLIDIRDNFDMTERNLENYTGDAVLCASDERKGEDNNQETYQTTDHLNRKEKSLHLENGSTFETMLEEIIALKNEFEEKYPNQENVEKDVLTELERLINLVNSDDIPPDVTLVCLQNFNKELDLQGFGDQVTVKEEGEVNNQTGGCKTKQAKQEVVYRYSKEDLVTLRTGKTFLDKMDIQLRMRLDETKLWSNYYKNLYLD